MEPHRTGVTAHTQEGFVIKARHMIFATGYELPRGVPTKGHKLISTWAIATRPQPRRLWHQQCLIWEASDPYLYLRTTDDGRVICGGLDEPFSDEQKRDALIATKAKALTSKLDRLLPGINPTPAFAWTGTFGASSTGTPTIGRVPRMPNCYAVLGYGGNGITFSMLAAQMLRATLTGKKDHDASLFSFTR